MSEITDIYAVVCWNGWKQSIYANRSAQKNRDRHTDVCMCTCIIVNRMGATAPMLLLIWAKLWADMRRARFLQGLGNWRRLRCQMQERISGNSSEALSMPRSSSNKCAEIAQPPCWAQGPLCTALSWHKHYRAAQVMLFKGNMGTV